MPATSTLPARMKVGDLDFAIRQSARLRINPATYRPLPEPVPLPPFLPGAESEAA